MTQVIRVLAPVWGARYVDMFLNVCVPSMLAPRNLPMLAREFPCEFVFLTRAAEETRIRRHPTFAALVQICQCSFTAIDDIILPGMEGYSLTRAFGRGIFDVGAKMTDTYFIFMNADFVVSDGAFETLLHHIRLGAHAIMAPSLRSVADETLPIVQEMSRDHPQTLIAPPRDLVAVALDHLHPTATANVVGANISHNAATNQFFWWIDERTLLGHFFLLFMLCIRPERVLDRIEGFCDYAFVPELCPSGAVTIIDDSDQCFLLEIQARRQEINYLRFGSFDTDATAQHLASWTTAHHRRYSRQPILIHAGDPPAATETVKHDAAAYVDSIHRAINRAPMPSINHPYWIGARASAERLTAMRLTWSSSSTRGELQTGASAHPMERWLRRTFRSAIGQPPRVNRFHYDWLDYRHVMPVIDRAVAEPSLRILYIASGFNAFDHVFAEVKPRCRRIDLSDLLGSTITDGPFDFCFIYLTGRNVQHAAATVAAVERSMRPGATIFVMLHDDSFECMSSSFSGDLLQQSRRVLPLGHRIASVQITTGVMKAMVRDAIIRSADRIAHRGIAHSLGTAVRLIGLFAAMLFVNLRGTRRNTQMGNGQCSSVLLDIRAEVT